MKRTLKFLLTILASAVLMAAPSCSTAEAANGGEVYICTGPKAKVYHTSPNCKGLNKCSGSVKKVSRSSVKRRACRICS